MHQEVPNEGADAGARLAIRLLQDAAERGDLDPWDVDVIAVVDGFLDQLRQRIEVPRQIAAALAGRGGSYEQDLAESSEAWCLHAVGTRFGTRSWPLGPRVLSPSWLLARTERAKEPRPRGTDPISDPAPWWSLLKLAVGFKHRAARPLPASLQKATSS